MAFVSLANALFLYICCTLEYLYFVKQYQLHTFKNTFHIMVPRPHGAGRCSNERLTSSSLADEILQ